MAAFPAEFSGNGQTPMTGKRILVLPRYTAKGPSSRVRMYQYLPYMRKAGFVCDVHPFFGDEYIDALFHGKRMNIFNILRSYFRRIICLLRTDRYDIVWAQYELLPWLPYWIEWFLLKGTAPLVIDYDDAAFHRYDMHKSVYIRTTLGKKIDRLMRSAAVVVAGNDYLAGRACEAGAKQLEVVPSVVDLGRYELKDWEENDAILRAGWIGTPQTIKYLLEIEGVIRALADEDISFILIGAEVPPQFAGLPVESKKWSLESEVQAIRELDVGIMPLADLPFERGKCGYKLIQYMACGLPVVASPVGLNHQIVHHGENGFLAGSESEWIEAFNKLQKSVIKRKEMGARGRKIVEDSYSLRVTATMLVKLFDQMV